jgi:hypothetical protein
MGSKPSTTIVSIENAFCENEPILITDITDLYPELTRQAVHKKVNKAIDEGVLKRYMRGVYYRPVVDSVIGECVLNPEKVLDRKWLEHNGETYGYISGRRLENILGLSPQFAAQIDVVTNKESSNRRMVPGFGGYSRFCLHKPRTPVTNDNVDALQFLDILGLLNEVNWRDKLFGKIGAKTRALAAKAGKTSIFECATYYPSATVKRLLECETNGLFA